MGSWLYFSCSMMKTSAAPMLFMASRMAGKFNLPLAPSSFSSLRFHFQIPRLGGVEHPVDDETAFDFFEFPVVVVISKAASGLAHGRPDAIEGFAQGGAVLRGLQFIFVEIRTGDEGAFDQRGLSQHRVEFGLQAVDANMHAGHAQSGLANGGGGFRRREIAITGEFNGGIADGGDFFDGGGKVLVKIITDGPHLQGDGNGTHRRRIHPVRSAMASRQGIFPNRKVVSRTSGPKWRGRCR